MGEEGIGREGLEVWNVRRWDLREVVEEEGVEGEEERRGAKSMWEEASQRRTAR